MRAFPNDVFFKQMHYRVISEKLYLEENYVIVVKTGRVWQCIAGNII